MTVTQHVKLTIDGISSQSLVSMNIFLKSEVFSRLAETRELTKKMSSARGIHLFTFKIVQAQAEVKPYQTI